MRWRQQASTRNAESIMPAAGMAEMMPISRVLAPASCRRNDTSGKLAPKLKPTTETANNRPASKRMFMYHSLQTEKTCRHRRARQGGERRESADQFRRGVARR
ncbi:hypothetical protein D3C76_1111030 [compost metagenome]